MASTVCIPAEKRRQVVRNGRRPADTLKKRSIYIGSVAEGKADQPEGCDPDRILVAGRHHAVKLRVRRIGDTGYNKGVPLVR